MNIVCMLCGERDGVLECPKCGRLVCGRCVRVEQCKRCRQRQMRGMKKAGER